MRTYKFKGYSEDTKQWHYGSLITNKDGHDKTNEPIPFIYTEFGGSFVLIKVVPESVAQFTCEYDMDGNEVYEKDILLHKEGMKKESYYTVEFKGGRFERVYRFNIRGYDEETIMPLLSKYYRLVGTVYQDSELLKANFKAVKN